MVILGVSSSSNLSVVFPLLWHMKRNFLHSCTMSDFKCLLSLALSENIKGQLQNAEDLFFRSNVLVMSAFPPRRIYGVRSDGP